MKQYYNKDYQNAVKIVNLPDPSAAQDAATKNYVDTVASGISAPIGVKCRTTGNVTISTALNNADTIDGIALVTGDLVLVDQQTTATEDGIYVVGVSPARYSGFPVGEDARGQLVIVAQGTVNAVGGAKLYIQTAQPAIVGTDGLTFTVMNSGTTYTAGAGITDNSSTFDIVATDTSVTVAANDLGVNLNTTGGLETSTGVRVKLNGSTLTRGASGLSVTTPVDTSVHARWFEASGAASAGTTITVAHGLAKRAMIVQVKLKTSSDTKDEDVTDGVLVEVDTTNIVVTFGASQADRSLFRVVWVG